MPKHFSFNTPESEFIERPKRPTWELRKTCYVVELDFDLGVDRTLCLTADTVGSGTWRLLSVKQYRLAEAILRVPGVKTVELGMNRQLKFHVALRCDRTLIYAGIAAALSQVYGAHPRQQVAA